MPWPEAIGSLLARPNSPAAQALRWGLHGLRASLQATLEEVPLDPGCEDLRALLAEIGPLLDRGHAPAGQVLPIDGGGARPADEPPHRLDPRVASPEDEDLRPLAGIVSDCLWLAEHDPHLSHGLRSVFRFGLVPLTGDQRERYVAELLRLWGRVRTGAGGSEVNERLKAHLDLDEALHSLVRQPPAAPDPRLARLQTQARAALFAARDQAVQAGRAVHLQELGGNFAEINRLAPESLQVDFGVPGEVCACLRVWARVDGEELKGRVLYRSPQESS